MTDDTTPPGGVPGAPRPPRPGNPALPPSPPAAPFGPPTNPPFGPPTNPPFGPTTNPPSGPPTMPPSGPALPARPGNPMPVPPAATLSGPPTVPPGGIQPLRPAQSTLLPQAQAAAAAAAANSPPASSTRPHSIMPLRPLQPTLQPLPVGGAGAPGAAPGAGATVAPGARGHSWLRVERLYYTYPDGQFTLSIGHLEFYPGELTYIGGESGSGKSTLIKILATAQEPTSGELWVCDQPALALPVRDREDLRGAGITYIPQGHLGLLDQTPVANIQRFLHDYDGLDWSEATAVAERALDRSGLPRNCFERSIKQLSGGQQARVAIARAEATGRPICLSDEILPALDANSRKAVLGLFQRLAAQQYTVVIIAHQPELKDHFHRVLEMSQGQIISDEYKPHPVALP